MNTPLKMYLYPRCGTCRKAKKYFEEKGIPFTEQHIVDEPLSEKELQELIDKSGLPPRKFFNTSGKKYRELGLKDKLPQMSEEEMVQLLASDGMLIKRPIVTDGTRVTVGFKEEEFDELWGSSRT